MPFRAGIRRGVDLRHRHAGACALASTLAAHRVRAGGALARSCKFLHGSHRERRLLPTLPRSSRFSFRHVTCTERRRRHDEGGAMRTCQLVTWVCATLLLAMAASAAPRMVARSSPGKTRDACKASAQGALDACKEEARSDKSLAIGKCANLPDASAAKACREQASADVKDALMTCKDQHDARLAVCARLGPAPYAPAIDPANFTDTMGRPLPINNPLFPLVPGTTFIYEGQTAAGLERDEFAVTHNTRTILGVTVVEVHDTVTTGGVLTEDTLDWFAQDRAGNVWYMGENSGQLEGGLIRSEERRVGNEGGQ